MILTRLISKVEASAMTGYTVHTGTNDKFSAGWDNIFASGKEKKGEKKVAEAAKKSENKAAKAEKKSDRKVKRGK
jgi:hypothetical protein